MGFSLVNDESSQSREGHVEWCKVRALEYCDHGDVQQAFNSLVSDLGKHPATAGHPAIQLGMGMLMTGHLNSVEAMRVFIEGVR